MEAVVEELLRTRGWKLATAESVTGGLVAQRLDQRGGSSQVFVGAVVASHSRRSRRCFVYAARRSSVTAR